MSGKNERNGSGTGMSPIMEKRKQLVDRIISMMENNDFFNNRAEWNRGAFAPNNPISNTVYKGGNRIRLMFAAYLNGYDDPRWMTFKQAADNGMSVKKGAKGITCEKWSFYKEKKLQDENGNAILGPDGKPVKETVELERPVCRMFTLFHASQIEGMPEIEITPGYQETEVLELADRLISSSECPVYERNQGRAYYSVTKDEIVLPPRAIFKDGESFVKTLIHEMGHSTGSPLRLHRQFGSAFGEEGYAKEELVAELAALFTENDLGLHLKAEHFEDHSDYMKSWISVLKNDYNVLFQAATEAEKAADRIVQRYRQREEVLQKDTVSVKETEQARPKKGR